MYIESGHEAKEHIHLLVSCPPNLSVSELVKRLKGRSSRKLLEEFGVLSRQFWGRRGYFAASSGNVTDEIIKQYIESQGTEPPFDSENISVEQL